MQITRQARLGVLLVVFPLLYQWYQAEQQGEEVLLSRLAAGWDAIRPPHKPVSRVAVGVNSNLDLIVSATQLFGALGLSPGKPVDHTHLGTITELGEQVGYSMLHCAGTERLFTSSDVFLKIVAAAYNIPHTHFIGGNAALMAVKIKQTRPGTQVMLAGPIGGQLRGLLHPHILTPTFTPDSQDEVHLIMEYPKGERWGDITSSCANRVIISHDVSNGKMVSLEKFSENLPSFSPDLIILSGAHLMQGESVEFQKRRLEDVTNLLRDVVLATTPVHCELATIGDLVYLKALADATFPYIDSLGLNEQELVSLARASKARGFDFDQIPGKPNISQVADFLNWLMVSYSFVGREQSRLTRVHFHTLSFHIIATALTPSRWLNSKSALLAGARIAGMQACDAKIFKPDKYELRTPLEFPLSVTDEVFSQRVLQVTPEQTVVEWERNGVSYLLTPVLVCKSPSKTVGLGDAISSTGLLFSQFNSQ